jgi:hypothetical protein
MVDNGQRRSVNRALDRCERIAEAVLARIGTDEPLRG